MMATVAATGGYFFWDFYRVKPIPARIVTLLPVWSWNEGSPSVSPVSATPGQAELVAEVEYFHDELLAYLSFDFLRNQKALGGRPVYLTPREEGPRVVYRMLVDAGDNWLTVYGEGERLKAEGLVKSWMVFQIDPEDVEAPARRPMFSSPPTTGPYEKTRAFPRGTEAVCPALHALQVARGPAHPPSP